MEAYVSIFTPRLGEASYSRPSRLNVVYLASAHKVLTFVTQGPASCHQGFGLYHEDSGRNLSDPPYQHASVLSLPPPGRFQVSPSALTQAAAFAPTGLAPP